MPEPLATGTANLRPPIWYCLDAAPREECDLESLAPCVRRELARSTARRTFPQGVRQRRKRRWRGTERLHGIGGQLCGDLMNYTRATSGCTSSASPRGTFVRLAMPEPNLARHGVLAHTPRQAKRSPRCAHDDLTAARMTALARGDVGTSVPDGTARCSKRPVAAEQQWPRNQ